MENQNPEKMRSIETRERGANVRITLKFIRHGERGINNELLPLGREITRENAQKCGISDDEFDFIKAIGSNVGPESEVEGQQPMGRALETAYIFGKEVSGKQGVPRRRKQLEYTSIKTPVPYDHKQIYNTNLPENFETLTGEERVRAAAKAQAAIVSHLSTLNTPGAQAYKDEVAGAFASTILHFIKMAGRLKSGSDVLIPAGSHGAMLEFLFQKGLIHTNQNGEVQVGFNHIDDMGGGMNPSEAFTIDIQTDNEGRLQELKVIFDDQKRLQGADMKLDAEIVRKLADAYDTLHADDKNQDEKNSK